VKKRRKRRTADEARAVILDVTEKHLFQHGPGGLRLEDIAADVGVSHPAILHHFGSREGLVQAVVDRALGDLENDLVTIFQSTDGAVPDGSAMLDRLFETLADRGHGRLIAWLVLSGYEDALDAKSARTNFKTLTDATHALRIAGGVTANYEDTAFTVLLSSLAIFGQAIIGPTAFQAAGFGRDKGAERRFREWLAGLLATHLQRTPEKREKPEKPEKA
jgi:TetR/AcrR family transcriptional regulator, repressor for neighboring sulfatase